MLVRFTAHFLRIFWHLRSVHFALFALILAGAVAIAGVEKMPIGEAVYFAFITGLTIGYGDIVTSTPVGRIISILLGFVGIVFTGMVVAAAVHAVQEAWKETQSGA